ncbi:MAG: hypothetical protein Q9227_002823 [Pyrenula ochraceoflavens]
MEKVINRFQRLEMGSVEAEEFDTCMMDLVPRQQVLEAKKARRPLINPRDNQSVGFMEAYPAAQVELRTALKEAFPGGNSSVEKILGTNIPYLVAACEEGFRLAGVAKGNLRQATTDTEILGCRIPKGAEVFMNYHVNYIPAPVDESKRTAGSKAAAAKFGDGFQSSTGRDLGAFDPRRWLVKEMTDKEAFNAHASPELSFGGGYRGCAGLKLAWIEYRIFATLLILNEDLKTMSASEKILIPATRQAGCCTQDCEVYDQCLM